MRRTVVIAANSAWNIANFRDGLIRGLREAGWDPVAVAPRDDVGSARLEALGIAHEAIGMARSGMNPAADLRLLWAYRTLLARLGPVAFLGFTIKPNIYGSLAASALGIPAIPNVSGLGTAFIRKGLLQFVVSRLYRRAFRAVPLVFFQNPDDRDLFVARRIVEADRTALLPGSGVDLERFEQSDQPDGPPVFLLVGRMLRDKGVVEFVEAARGLAPQLPGARFQLLGEIDQANRTAISRSDIDRWVDEGVVEYLGTSDDVRPFLKRASAVVLPSYREGLPRSLLEAAATGRPLIATDVPGCREIVEEGVNGYLCAAGDAESLAAAIARFATLPPKTRASMGNASRKKVQERFSEQFVFRAYVAALDRLAGTSD
ncbi:MAG: glycosyltransferase family 4 protein [Sphingomicrobium sp.]